MPETGDAGVTVLLADDDRLVADTVQEELAGQGCRVCLSGTGEAALVLARDMPELDVVLFHPDGEMKSEGIRTARALAALNTLPLVLVLDPAQYPFAGRVADFAACGVVSSESRGESLLASVRAACALHRKHALIGAGDEELRKAQLIVENIPTGLYIYHLEDPLDDRTLRMVYANPAVGLLTGLSPGGIVGKTLDENFPGLRSQGVPQRYARVVRTQTVDEFDDVVYGDERVPLAAFSVKAFPLPGNQMGVAFENITARRQAEAALRESEERLKETSRIARVGGWEIDLEGNTLVWTEEIFRNYELETDIPPSVADAILFYHQDDRERVEAAVRHALEHGNDFDFEARLVTAKGNLRWVRAIGSIVYRDGKPVGVRGMQQDITDRKLAEEAQERLQGQLLQAQRMDSIGRLAGGVAHDFNNMLGVILGHAELALEGVKPGEPLYADLQGIKTAAEHSADLTRQLLAFARRQTVVPQAVELNQAVTSMLRMLKRIIGENIELEWLPCQTSTMVLLDPSQIDQLLANLCVNARDAIADTGRISIETGSRNFDDEYCAAHEGALPGEYVMLAVSDTGCGMEKDLLEKIFEPFFTTKEMGKGTGLGLATVYGIIRQNHGFINVYSEPGQGTTVRMYLPRYDVTGEAGGDQPRDTVYTGQARILLVEDSPENLRVTGLMLENLGHTVFRAASPAEALRIIREINCQVDMLLTDVVMPGMNGRELALQLSSHCPGVVCLFMSGYTANVIAHQGVLDEGVHFLQKPFKLDELGRKIHAVLAGRMG